MAKPKAPQPQQDKPQGMEFENFEELAKNLLAVSKKDLDEAREKERQTGADE